MPSPVTDGEPCGPAGRVRPVIDRRRCEAKGECVRVCPFGVFAMRTLREEEKSDLGWWSRLRITLHGGTQAVVIAPEACHDCGLCVTACPEQAISLVATANGGSQPGH